ncbi:MAG: zf-HC2 domain-containing protein [Kiritimatiellia bacterium]|nr:zf-HC2 domain-containing protein [Kiritimatiellia bacterium]
MNENKHQNRIYLKDAGELDPRDDAELKRHLRDCPDCRTLTAELAALHRATDIATPESRLPQSSLDIILNEARRAQKNSGISHFTRGRKRPFWGIPLAAAAAAALLLSVRALLWVPANRPEFANKPIAAVDPDGWLESFGQELDAMDLWMAGLQTEFESRDELDGLATELLALEGEQS